MKVIIGTDPLNRAYYQDLSEFIAFSVNLDGYLECNHFLLSFCHQLDINYSPEHCPDRAPWKYTPLREQSKGKGLACVTIGNVCTSIGVYTIAYTSRGMENIDTLYIYNVYGAHKKNKGKFRNLVKDAISFRDNTNEYCFKVKLHCHISNIKGETYIGENFKFSFAIDCFLLEFRIFAIDEREASDLSLQRVRHFLSFLAIETNLCFNAEEPELIQEGWTYQSSLDQCKYFHDYIDIASIDDDCLMLSDLGVRFIDNHIFTHRESTGDKFASAVIAGGEHIYEGSLAESRLGENLFRILPESVLMLKQPDRKYQVDVTKSLMSYMSALEVATINEGKPERCEYCNTELYHISHRIKDIAARYLNENLGKVFGKLYSLRSKYLHAGKYSTDFDQLHVRPICSPGTATGLIDAGFISLRMNGKSFLVYVMNVKEWTTYILRCYYQEKLFGKTEFNDTDRGNNDNAIGLYQHIKDYSIEVSSEYPDLQIEGLILT